MSFFYLTAARKLAEEKAQLEARCMEQEEVIRLLGRALDLVPIRVISGPSKAQWLPSDEAIKLMALAKDRLGEWRILDR